MKEFNNKDLKAGMLVELYNGIIGILIPIQGELEVFSKNMEAITNAYLLDESVDFYLDKSYAIIKVYGLCKCYDLFNPVMRDLLWEYTEPKKDLTIKEIETLFRLANKNKIVDNRMVNKNGY